MNGYLGNSIYTKITYPNFEIKNRLNAFAKKLKFHISSQKKEEYRRKFCDGHITLVFKST